MSGHISRETLNTYTQENCFKGGHCFIVCNRKILETTINSRMCKLIVDYLMIQNYTTVKMDGLDSWAAT